MTTLIVSDLTQTRWRSRVNRIGGWISFEYVDCQPSGFGRGEYMLSIYARPGSNAYVRHMQRLHPELNQYMLYSAYALSVTPAEL